MPHTQTVVLSRSELYEMAWAKPLTVLGRELSLPPLTLSSILKNMDIPMPPSGHWQKVAAGKPFERPALPDPERNASREFEVVSLKDGERWEDLPLPTARGYRDYEIAERSEENAIVVPEVLASPHRLVRESLRLLSKGNVDKEYGWVRPPLGEDRARLDVCVSPEKLDLALRIFDALIRALEKRGLTVQVSEEKSAKDSTYVTIDSERVTFGIYERLERVEVLKIKEWDPDFRWAPSGKLALRIYGAYAGSQKVIEATLKKSLEERLNDFVIKLYQEAEEHKKERAEAERRQLERAAEEKRQLELQLQRYQEERRQQQEAAKLKELEDAVSRWHRAANIRQFVAAVHAAHAAYGGVPDDSEQGRYLTWALAAADRLDPLTPLSPGPDAQSEEGEESP